MIDTLNEEELEITAQSSYAYWLKSLSDRPPTEEQRQRMALREARRILFKNPFEKAEKGIKEIVQYRKVSRLAFVSAWKQFFTVS